MTSEVSDHTQGLERTSNGSKNKMLGKLHQNSAGPNLDT
jgi:hypothetical protein